MKCRKLPSTFKESLSFDWWKYCALIVCLCIGWHYIYQTKNALKDEQIIAVYSNAQIEDDRYSEKVLKEHGGHGIEQMTFVSIGNDEYTNTILQSKAVLDGDLLLIYEKYIDSSIRSKAFVLDDDFQNSILTINPKIQFLFSDDGVVGVKVFAKGEEDYNASIPLNDSFAFQETTYLLANKNSSNVSSADGAPYGRCALDVFLAFLMKGV